MCGCEGRCRKPENLKSTPGECSPEQIEACHGDDTVHECEKKKEGN